MTYSLERNPDGTWSVLRDEVPVATYRRWVEASQQVLELVHLESNLQVGPKPTPVPENPVGG